MKIESTTACWWQNGGLHRAEAITASREPETSFVTNYDFDGPVVYEVIRIMAGRPLFLTEHLERMEASVEMLEVRQDTTSMEGTRPWRELEIELRTAIKTVVEENALVNNNLKLLIGNRGHAVLVYPIASYYPPAEVYSVGVETDVVREVRQNPHVKVINEDLTSKIAQLRKETGIFEALLCNLSGEIAEGSRSNVFFVLRGELVTPPSEGVLMGITRQKVMEAAYKAGIVVKEQLVHINDLDGVEGAFLTGTSLHILPICRIGDKALTSSNHPVIVKLMQAFKELIEASRLED